MDPSEHLRPDEFLQHREFLCRLARSLLRDAARAEDVVHGAFALALERPPRDAQSLGLWLRTAVRRLAFNVLRDEGRRRAREQAMVRPEACAASDEAVASLEIQELVIGAVRSLAEPYRTTLWLRYYEDLSRKDIARRQGVPERTVQTRLARGQAQLREELDRRSGGDRTQWLSGMLLLARGPGGPALFTLIGVGLMKKLVIGAVLLVGIGVAWKVVPSSRVAMHGDEPPAVADLPPEQPTTSPAVVQEQRTAVVPEQVPLARAEEHTSLVVHVRWPDGSPASDVGLILHPESDPRGERAVQRASSDESGLVQVDTLAPGTVRIEADRGGELRATLTMGEKTEVVFQLQPGVDVEGTVMDGAGNALAGAEVLLVTDAPDWLATRVVARTAASGAFFVRDVDPALSVSARAGAFVPAGLVALRGRPRGAIARVVLVLASYGAALHGRVLDPELRPVAGALVTVGDASGYAEEEKGLATEHRGMPTVVTDSEGRFRTLGVDMTRGLPVAVLAEGFPVFVGGFAGDIGTSTFAEIVLAPPCTLEGTVRDEEGRPVAGAEVRALSFAGEQARDVPFALPRTTSDAEGRYVLALLPPGPVGFGVQPPAGSALGRHFARVTLAAGASTLDVVLPADDSIRGRVVDDLGRPARGATVHAYSIGGVSRIQKVPVDERGAFVLTRCTELPYTVTVADAAGRRLLRVREVGPTRDELVLRVPAAGSLSGVLVEEMPSQRAPKAWLVGAGNEYGYDAEWEGDRFTFPVLPPGSYRLCVQAGSMHRLGRFAVRAGEHVEVGTIHGPRRGSLRVAFEPVPAGSLSLVLLERGFEIAEPADAFEERLTTDVVAGSYLLRVDADGYASRVEPVEVRPDEETQVVIRLEEGVTRTLAFSLADPAAEWSWIRVALRDARGRLAFARREERYGARPSVLARLAPGDYVVEAETDTGLTARGAFSVLSLTDQDAALTFDLR
jgi:RNA polymerase sigma-70 factor (ECF subfamily)